MADIAASDVTYTEIAGSVKASPSDPRRSAVFTLAFGNGTLTYPSGGVPVTKAKLGCPTNVDEFIVMDIGASGYTVKYDLTNNKIRLFNPTATHAHDLLVKGGQAAASTAALAHYATDILGKEAATDATITAAASATKGGVVSRTASAGAELGNVAVTATTLKIKVVGY